MSEKLRVLLFGMNGRGTIQCVNGLPASVEELGMYVHIEDLAHTDEVKALQGKLAEWKTEFASILELQKELATECGQLKAENQELKTAHTTILEMHKDRVTILAERDQLRRENQELTVELEQLKSHGYTQEVYTCETPKEISRRLFDSYQECDQLKAKLAECESENERLKEFEWMYKELEK